MQLILVAGALYLLLYAPGHYWLRRSDDSPPVGSWLLREILLSACCTSWIGFVLAEAGFYSLPALLAVLAGLAIVGRARRGGGALAQSYRARDALGVAVAVLTWLWVAPPLDTRLMASDST